MARSKLRAFVQKLTKELANLVASHRDLGIAVSDHGIRFVERHKPFQVTRIGALYEESLEVIGFLR